MDTFIPVTDLEWKTVRIHEQPPYNDQDYLYELELFKPLADWDVWRYWERERIESMQQHIRQGDIVLDVGAEQGWMSALISKYMSDQIVLVEPTAEFWPGIKAIYEKNGLTPPIDTFRGFCGESSNCVAKAEPSVWPSSALDDEVIEKRKYENLFDNKDVPELRIDDMTYKPAHITIDVEGAELLVLKGAKKTLKNVRPLIWCSVHPDMMERDYGHTKDQLLEYMESCGYAYELLAVDHEHHYFFEPRTK